MKPIVADWSIEPSQEQKDAVDLILSEGYGKATEEQKLLLTRAHKNTIFVHVKTTNL